MNTKELKGLKNWLRRISLFILPVAMIIFTGPQAPARAFDPRGTWISASGSTIDIWNNKQQLMVTVISPNGASNSYHGCWLSPGIEFTYQTAYMADYRCRFLNNGDTIQVRDSRGGKYLWTRWTGDNTGTNQNHDNSKTQTEEAAIIDGIWKSTSGSSVQLTTRGNQIFVVLITPQGHKYEGCGRWLAPNSRFDYSVAGFSGSNICTISPGNRNRITVMRKNGETFYWTR